MTVNMPKIGLYVTLRCSLKCKRCVVYAPYYKKPYHPTLEYLYQNIDRYFEVVDHVQLITLTGGEPLLRKDLPHIAQKVRQCEDRIGRLEIITNGAVIPSDELIEELEKFKIGLNFIIDDYGPDKSANALAAYKKFQEIKGAAVALRDNYSENMHCGGWVDFGISADRVKKTSEEAKKLFAKCAFPQKLGFCASIIGGKIYPCTQLRRAIEVGLIPPDSPEVIDLFDSSQSDASIKERINAFYDTDVLSACEYCDGLCDDSVRYPAAEQLTKEEQALLWR